MRIKSVHPIKQEKKHLLPLINESVQAGFPSPADDYIEERLDLNDLMVAHPAATFFVRVTGESMKEAQITSGDILVVDRSLEPKHNQVVVAILNGEFTVKRLKMQKGQIHLCPDNSAYPNIEITPECQFEVWGVVTFVIHPIQ